MLKLIKKNRKLYALTKLLRTKKKDEIIDKIIDDNAEKFYVEIQTFGLKNKDQVIYFIDREDKGEGFFAMLRTTLYHLAFAERFHFTPFISWSRECAYYQEEGYEGRINPYEYYFKEPSNLTLENVKDSYNVIVSNEKNVKVLSEYPLDSPYYYDEKFIDRMAKIMKKYVDFQESIELMLKQDTQNILTDQKMLGVHYRGTDFKVNYDAHPKYVEPSKYFESIDEALCKCNIAKIFIATDDIEALQVFIERYGERIVYYTDVLRGKGDTSAMYGQNSRKNNNFLKGYEVLRDVYTLSMMDAIVSGVSMVSVFARVYKKVMDKEYEFDLFVESGTNKNNKKYVT